LLLLVTISPGVVTLALKTGCVPTVVESGVIGMLNGLVVPLGIGLGSVHVTVLPAVVQVQPPPGVKLAGAVTPGGNGIVTTVGPLVGAEPTLLTATGRLLCTPSFKVGVGWPKLMVTSGVPKTTGAVIGAAGLLPGLESPGVVVVAVKVGVVPTAAGVGVIGTAKVLLVPAAIGPGLVQVTVPLVVVQVQPLLVKVAGAVTPEGKGSDVLIGPVVGPVPMLVTVTGRLLVTPSLRTGVGWPSVVVKSGALVTGAVVMDGALLLAGLLSFGVVTPAFRMGVVPIAVGPGVIGIEIGLLVPGLIGLGSVQVTVVAVEVQLQGPLVKVAGEVMPVGNGTVTVATPLGAEPVLVTVTGTWLVTPAWKTGDGWPITIDRSDLVQSAAIVV
jgi:hypothetical protein